MNSSSWPKVLYQYFEGLLKWEDRLSLLVPWGQDLVMKVLQWHKVESTARELHLSSPSRPCPEFQYPFEEERMRQSFKEEIVSSQLKEIDGAFRRDKIEFVVLKGMFWGEQIYPTALWRHIGDIDLLVRPEARESALLILLRLGYRMPAEGFSFKEEISPLRGETMVIPSGKEHGQWTSVELHWKPLHSARFMRRLGIETEDLFSFATSTNFRGLQLLLPRPEVRFGYLVVHGICHHQLKRFLQLMDLAHLLRKNPSLDFDFLSELLRKWKAMIPLYFALKALWLFGFREGRYLEFLERLERVMPWRVRLFVKALSPTRMLHSYSRKGNYTRKIMRVLASEPLQVNI